MHTFISRAVSSKDMPNGREKPNPQNKSPASLPLPLCWHGTLENPKQKGGETNG